MALHLHRSNAVESLVAELAQQLHAHWPRDPFEPVGIVVGSRGMERWLRHQLATHHGIAARLDFPFPRQAFDGATALLADATTRADFWNHREVQQTRWQVDTLAFSLVPHLRHFLSHADFKAVQAYLGKDVDGPVSPRELTFARQVAEALDRLMHERGADAVSWQTTPEQAPPTHRWLAHLLHALGDPEAPSPAEQLQKLLKETVTSKPHRLHVFGLSTMGPGDVQRLGSIGKGLNVHVYVLAPSPVWWAHVNTRGDLRRKLRQQETDAARREVERDLASQNPVLAALGGPSRDLQVQLEELDYHEDERVPPLGIAAPGLLGQLQTWVGQAEALPRDAQWELANGDRSFVAHATYGPTRQVEALRDELLRLFAADPTLEPRHVLVMTPDIETYAPLVAAVFARSGLTSLTSKSTRLPTIPTAIADLGLRSTNPLAEVLLQVLTLAGERVTAAALLELLTLQPVRERLELAPEDLTDLRDLIADSGMRWAFDAADRHRHADQPELDQNTIRFGLERLALGVLLPDEAATLDVIPGLPMPITPEPVASTERVARVGKLIGFARQVQAFCESLRTPRTADVWANDLNQVLDVLTETAPTQAWLRASVIDVVQLLEKGAEPLGLPLERTALLRWLQGRFELPQKGDRAVASAVTVCALEPMRSVPFRVVALLGMDDGKFPRGSQVPGWDPFADGRRTGERDRREIDRHLLLEALLSARTHFWLFWSGRDVGTGKPLPAAVPVEELLETLGRLTGLPRERLVRSHPLQPWSPQEFAADDPQTFDHGLLLAARSLDALRRGSLEAQDSGLLALQDAVLAPEREQQSRLSVAHLADGLLTPQKLLLKTRMQLSLSEETTTLETREPLELGSLGGWAERDRLLNALLAPGGETPDLLQRAVAHAAGRGALPLEAGGGTLLAGELAAARRTAQRVAHLAWPACPAPDVALRLDDGTELYGNVPAAYEREGQRLLHWATASKQPNAKAQLTAWLTLLVARASGEPVAAARVAGSAEKNSDAETWFVPPTAEEAHALLVDLVTIWRAARNAPLPLFARTSPAAAAKLAADPEAPLQAVLATAWTGGEYASGDADEPAVVRLFGAEPPRDLALADGPWSLRDLATRVWVPVIRGTVSPSAPEIAGWVDREQEAK